MEVAQSDESGIEQQNAGVGTARETKSDDATPGGGGQDLSRTDLEQIRQAARDGWNVPSDIRATLIKRLRATVADPKTSTRTLLSVGRVLRQFDKADSESREAAPPEPERPQPMPDQATMVAQAREMMRLERPTDT
jgi:hypothetical protein